MIELWYGILCLMFAMFIILDGWDFGAGALHLIVARTPEERRQLIAAIGPLWSWHEVWLVGSGGVLFVAFPRVMSIAFPAYYLALYLVLWTLLLRGISIEFRGHVADPLWHSFWDVVFSVANIGLAILFGAAIGNVVRGIPLSPETPLSLPLFTDPQVNGRTGLLDWYTVSFALFSLICLAAHGASYLATRTQGPLYERCSRAATRLWIAAAALLVLVTIETTSVRPQLFEGMRSRPPVWIALLVFSAGVGLIVSGGWARNDNRRFIGGCSSIAGLLGTAATSLFPVMLHSTLAADYSITAFNGSSDPEGLRMATYWWPFALILALGYSLFIARYYRGRVSLSEDTQRPY